MNRLFRDLLAVVKISWYPVVLAGVHEYWRKGAHESTLRRFCSSKYICIEEQRSRKSKRKAEDGSHRATSLVAPMLNWSRLVSFAFKPGTRAAFPLLMLVASFFFGYPHDDSLSFSFLSLLMCCAVFATDADEFPLVALLSTEKKRTSEIVVVLLLFIYSSFTSFSDVSLQLEWRTHYYYYYLFNSIVSACIFFSPHFTATFPDFILSGLVS